MKKIYTLSAFLTPAYRKRVFPLLFDLYFLENEVIKQNFCFVDDVRSADVAILPVDVGVFLQNKKDVMLREFVSAAKSANIPIWIYSAGDFGSTLNADFTTFRLGGFHSKLTKQTQILPSFVNDPYSTILTTQWKSIAKQDLPTVGFVGNADGSNYKWVKELLLHLKNQTRKLLKKDPTDCQPFYPASWKRYKLLTELENSKDIRTDFIFRSKYRGGAASSTNRNVSTLEFFRNIEQNLYTFCLRGAGNFSVRFYETLIMGRIPLLIDTDCRLPFHEDVDWNAHCVIVNESNFIEVLLAFHYSKSDEEIIKIQEQNRDLALTLLSRQGYFIKTANAFLNK